MSDARSPTDAPSACPTLGPRRRPYKDGARDFPTVEKGWARARVLALLGPPDSCEGEVWTYVAGPFTGPELRYLYRFQSDQVATIDVSRVGCRLVE